MTQILNKIPSHGPTRLVSFRQRLRMLGQARQMISGKFPDIQNFEDFMDSGDLPGSDINRVREWSTEREDLL